MTPAHLDESQLSAVEITADSRQLVIAGPGSGKTEVVSALVEHLVDDEDVDPSNGILVISFSNAAVFAADARLRAHGAGPVNVQTMDSLASEILRDLALDDYRHFNFDGRIVLGTRLLGDEGWDRLDEIEHLIVDEVQDVVGVRADFLLTIIEQLSDQAGFTLLGDPAQGIYDFQIRPEPAGRRPLSTTRSEQLLEVVSDLPNVSTRQLTGQYRAASRDARRAAALRTSALSNGDPHQLEDFHAELVQAGSVEEVADLARRWEGRTAFLTATNGQALLVAGALRLQDHAVEVRRSAHQRVLAAWVARLLADAPQDTISNAELEARAADRTPDLDPIGLWLALRRVSGGRGTEVNLRRLASGLRAPRPLAPELMDPTTAPFVVSTVHRAKGLEFDNVVLVDFPQRAWMDVTTDPGERLRTRFVAVTRARQRIVRATGPEDRNVRRLNKAGLHRERWYIGGPKPWMTFGYEIGVDDIEAVDEGAAAAQEWLAQNVSAGDELILSLDPDESTLAVPVYSVLHDELLIGRTSRGFGEDLAARIGTLDVKKGPWPALSGARVESVSTVVTDARADTPYRHGLHLAPIVTGLLDIAWKGTT